jgi:uncharacterized membrane protein
MKPTANKPDRYDSFFLILKGIAMGAANKVPGVSGGIVALVGGFLSKVDLLFSTPQWKSLKITF